VISTSSITRCCALDHPVAPLDHAGLRSRWGVISTSSITRWVRSNTRKRELDHEMVRTITRQCEAVR
jgi:hypothetical protein